VDNPKPFYGIINSMTLEIQAKNFKTRKDLEDFVATKLELNADKKDAVIIGKMEDLKPLHLSPRSIFYGIKIQATNPPAQRSVSPPHRGKIHDFGINQRDKSK